MPNPYANYGQPNNPYPGLVPNQSGVPRPGFPNPATSMAANHAASSAHAAGRFPVPGQMKPGMPGMNPYAAMGGFPMGGPSAQQYQIMMMQQHQQRQAQLHKQAVAAQSQTAPNSLQVGTNQQGGAPIQPSPSGSTSSALGSAIGWVWIFASERFYKKILVLQPTI